MLVLQPTPNPNDFSSYNPRSFDLSGQIPQTTTMYTTTTNQYQQTQPSFVYGNPSITYTSNNAHSRTSSATLPRQTQDGSFGLEANYSQLNYNNRYDQSSTNTGSDGTKSQQQNPSPNIIPSTTANLSPDSPNVLPPLSEVFPSSSTAPSPTQTNVQVQAAQAQAQAQQQQQQQVAAAAAAQNFFYPDVNAAAAAAANVAGYAENAGYGGAAQNPLISQQQQAAALSQSQIPTLPSLQAQMLDPSRRSSNALLINTGLAMGTDQSPLSAGSSTASPIVYQHPAAAHQAILNNSFMAAAQSMNGMMASSQRMRSNKYRTDDDLTSGDRPQKVYSFVALPGINTKKRPRRRYDEIERHYACNYAGCTKSYGTLNHLNAHVQMQKHGPKRHPSEFKELRKQWRRQKREEEERKAAEVAAAKNAAVTLNMSTLPSI